MSVLRVEELRTHFFTDDGVVKAVDGVSFEVERGRILGLVGESGSGKSVTNLSVLRLVPSPPGRYVGGRILFHGEDILKMPEADLRRLRGNRIAMIFQDPMTSLNPYLRVSRQIGEVLELHEGMSRRGANKRATELLEMVGIPDPETRIDQYPHEFSGGMRQRVMIAMALACKPELLLADEPTTALDVTIQAQILDLIRDLCRELGTAVILVTHDLGVVAGLADDVAVMYAGRIVEQAPVVSLFSQPQHPYTKALLSAIPVPKPGRKKDRVILKGDVPNPIDPPSGCHFHTRCPVAEDRCRSGAGPATVNVSATHSASCHLIQGNGGSA